jgi:acyl-CoA dehydrogenase
MRFLTEIPLPHLELTGLDCDLTDSERSVLETVHRFASEVMRPAGAKLDRMAPDEVVAAGSPFFDFLKQLSELGVSPLAIAGLEPDVASRLLPLVAEELAWGDPGLTIAAIAGAFPALAAHLHGDPEVVDRFGSRLGCWLATQPDRGSDVADMEGTALAKGTRHNAGSLRARVTSTEVILSGQSSAWVSVGPVAETALAYVAADYGQGHHRADGTIEGVAVLVPLDVAGVSRGKPLDKLGQRALPQGEIYFDEVRVPRKYVIAGRETFHANFFTVLAFANMEMSASFTGVARAAFEHALAYSHERRQGGVPIIEHQTVRHRLFEMWRKTESARAMARRVANYNFKAPNPHVLASITAKVHCTQMAFEVANESVQIFGGNGLSRDYPVEKLLRDARAALIEDGENTVLGLVAADWLSRSFKSRTAR